MRTFIIRGAMITFFAVTGLFGSAATVQFDGMSASVESNSAVARMNLKENCESHGYDANGKYVCYVRGGVTVPVP